GSGKTAIIAQLVKDAMDFPGTRVLILTHVKELLEQGAQGLLKMYPQAQIGFYSASLGQKRLDQPITFAGIQSVWKRAFDMVPPPDLVLIDEAHMVPKNTNTRYGSFLDDLRTANPAVKVVGLTATPYRLDSGMLHEGDEALFDGIAYDIPVGQLMDQGYLRAEGHSVAVVTGADGMKERAAKIEQFRRGEIRALVNCNVLTTGFDVPTVDLVAIVRATESTGLYVQIVGRGTRIADGKENCLILDYGGNVARHGFIDAVNPNRKGGSGEGDAPAKECPECEMMCHAAVRTCPACGYDWPAPQFNHGHKAYDGALLSKDAKAEWLHVDDVTYQKWTKPGKPDSVRVTYRCGLTIVSEWLCPDHGGYAASRYHARKCALGATADTTAEAMAECDAWNQPSRIKVRPDGKFHQIMQLDYKPKEEDRAAEAERQRVDAILEDFM
ncbi:MAG: hypothetical protein EBT12_02665, partial [Marivivens sp.]|nr:hypothetical protein [Marivivens sp.]